MIFEMEGVKVAADLAFRCEARDKDDKSDVREVVEELRQIQNRISEDEAIECDIGNS